MTKEELGKLRHLIKEAESLRKEIENLPTVTDSVTGSMTEHPYIACKVVIMGFDKARREKLRNRYRRKLSEIEKKIDEINVYIDSVGDSLILQLLYLQIHKMSVLGANCLQHGAYVYGGLLKKNS